MILPNGEDRCLHTDPTGRGQCINAQCEGESVICDLPHAFELDEVREAMAAAGEKMRARLTDLLVTAQRLKIAGETIGRRCEMLPEANPADVLADTMKSLVLLDETYDRAVARDLLIDLMAAALAEVERIDDES